MMYALPLSPIFDNMGMMSESQDMAPWRPRTRVGPVIGQRARRLFLPSLALFLLTMGLAGAGDVRLTIAIGSVTRSLGAEDLLRDPATVEIEVPQDIAYGRAMRYRALPMAELLQGFALPPDQAIEAVANDGFAATLPLDLLRHRPGGSGSVAYLAIEPPASPWPKLPGKSSSAGPFYIVWLRPEADGIRQEQWPYGVVEIRSADLPEKRWPGLAVDPKLPADDPRRAGEGALCHHVSRLPQAEWRRQRRGGAGSQSAEESDGIFPPRRASRFYPRSRRAPPLARHDDAGIQQGSPQRP